MKCRHCHADVRLELVDLGMAPPSNAYLSAEQFDELEIAYPLRVLVCESCWLVQTEDFVDVGNLFNSEYAYFSSTSSSWVEHARDFVEAAVCRFDLSENSLVAEIASNDGYLLQFVQQRGIPCYGIEPTKSTAAIAREKGISVIEEFFTQVLSRRLASDSKRVDLLVANNVLAHVPDINDFALAVANLLKQDGIATFEFPSLVELVRDVKFDTIYHEHFSYLSLSAINRIFVGTGLRIVDVEKLSTHGGSLRVYARRFEHEGQSTTAVADMMEEERKLGVETVAFYTNFQSAVEARKAAFLTFLNEQLKKKRKIVAYGAAAKGNTLLNFAGATREMISYVVDRSEGKIGRFLPGSRIPIVAEDHLKRDKPDIVIILPWNLKKELSEQLRYVEQWEGQLAVALPAPKFLT